MNLTQIFFVEHYTLIFLDQNSIIMKIFKLNFVRFIKYLEKIKLRILSMFEFINQKTQVLTIKKMHADMTFVTIQSKSIIFNVVKIKCL